MRNYKVRIGHGTLTFDVMIRGTSQEDAETYISEHTEDLQGLRVSDSPFVVINTNRQTN